MGGGGRFAGGSAEKNVRNRIPIQFQFLNPDSDSVSIPFRFRFAPPTFAPVPRPATDPEAKRNALRWLGEGVSQKETARRAGVSPATVHRWKAEADSGSVSEPESETEPKRNQAPQTEPKSPPPAWKGVSESESETEPGFGTETESESPSLPGAVSLLLAEKDARIADLNRTVETLSDALSEEREARRRADVMLQHALARPSLPPSGGGSVPPGSRWEKVLFGVAVAVLALLAIALLLR